MCQNCPIWISSARASSVSLPSFLFFMSILKVLVCSFLSCNSWSPKQFSFFNSLLSPPSCYISKIGLFNSCVVKTKNYRDNCEICLGIFSVSPSFSLHVPFSVFMYLPAVLLCLIFYLLFLSFVNAFLCLFHLLLPSALYKA